MLSIVIQPDRDRPFHAKTYHNCKTGAAANHVRPTGGCLAGTGLGTGINCLASVTDPIIVQRQLVARADNIRTIGPVDAAALPRH